MRSARERAAGPDRIEERHRTLDRGCGHDLALDGSELVTQVGHALLCCGSGGT